MSQDRCTACARYQDPPTSSIQPFLNCQTCSIFLCVCHRHLSRSTLQDSSASMLAHSAGQRIVMHIVRLLSVQGQGL